MKRIILTLIGFGFILSLNAQAVNNLIDYETQITPIPFSKLTEVPNTLGTPTQILQMNAAGTALEFVDPVTAPFQTADNGTNLNGTILELGGALNKNTDIGVGTFNFTATSADGVIEAGQGNGVLDLMNGVGFISEQGADASFIGTGDHSGLGYPNTNQATIASGNFATGEFSNINTAKANLILNSQNTTNSAVVNLDPNATIPKSSIVLNDPTHQLGQVSLFDPAKQYSNIFWAVKSPFKDVSRIEASSLGSRQYWNYDPNVSDNFLQTTLNATGYFIEDSQAGNLFLIDPLGEAKFDKYPNTRDDAGSPINVLTTDAAGNVQSHAVSDIAVDKSADTFVELAGGETSITLNAAPSSSNDIIVYLNGQQLTFQGSTPDWTLVGTTLTFTSYVGVAGHFIEVFAR